MPESPWLVSAEDIARDAHDLVDVRDRVRFALGHAPGAVRLSWLTFRNGSGRTGRLRDDLPSIRRELEARGLEAGRRLAVYGDATGGWGEDGRIVWMLRYLGYARAALLDGGWQAIRSLPVPLPSVTHFRAQEVPSTVDWSLRATADDVQRIVEAGGAASAPLLIDTRSDAEWAGSRRYGPARTGQIPGAVHLHWREVLNREGRLDRTRALQRLSGIGAHPARAIVTYCVGGVRSAHMLVMLRALGFANVRNYDGSWYEWSADPARPIVRT